MKSEVALLLQSMNQEVRDNLATAVEIGKWPDGTSLTKEQRDNAMQAVMLWDSQHGQDDDEPFKVLKGGKVIRQYEKNAEQKSAEPTTDDKNKIKVDWR